MALLRDLRDEVKQATAQVEEHGDLERATAALARTIDVAQKAMAVMSRRGEDALTAVTVRDDGKFARTALVMPYSPNPGSVDLVDAEGQLLVRVNVVRSAQPDSEALIVDVIDVDDRFPQKRVYGFPLGGSQGRRTSLDVPEGGKLVSVNFRRPT
jgi:hypothetical protein